MKRVIYSDETGKRTHDYRLVSIQIEFDFKRVRYKACAQAADPSVDIELHTVEKTLSLEEFIALSGLAEDLQTPLLGRLLDDSILPLGGKIETD